MPSLFASSISRSNKNHYQNTVLNSTDSTWTNRLNSVPMTSRVTYQGFSSSSEAVPTNQGLNEVEMEDDIPFPDVGDFDKVEGFDLISHCPPRGKLQRGSLIGKVVSTKMQKTVNVAVDRFRIVPKYRKRLKYTRKFMAHDEDEICDDGDTVLITPCQKKSKRKNFEVAQILRKVGVL